MINKLKYLLAVMAIVVIQLMLDEFINLSTILHLSIAPLIIITLPYTTPFILNMLAAFGLGLIMDFSAEGVLGLNASALVALAFAKPYLLRLFVMKGPLLEMPLVSRRYIRRSSDLYLLLLLYACFFIFYVTIDSLGFFNIGRCLIRIVVYTVVNALFALFVESVTSSQLNG